MDIDIDIYVYIHNIYTVYIYIYIYVKLYTGMYEYCGSPILSVTMLVIQAYHACVSLVSSLT